MVTTRVLNQCRQWRCRRAIPAGTPAGIRDRYPLSLSLTALAGVKVNLRDAAMLMVSPVAGLRPSRAGLSLILNLPNPFKEISSPLAADSMIAAIRPSSIFLASDFAMPCWVATASTNYVVFICAPVFERWRQCPINRGASIGSWQPFKLSWLDLLFSKGLYELDLGISQSIDRAKLPLAVEKMRWTATIDIAQVRSMNLIAYQPRQCG